MTKCILPAVLALLANVATAQTAKPLPLRYEQGAFVSKWYLGNERIYNSQLGEHLKKHSPAAGVEFRQAKRCDAVGWLLLAVGTATFSAAELGGFNKTTQTGLYVGTGVAWGACLGINFASNVKFARVAPIYNRDTGN